MTSQVAESFCSCTNPHPNIELIVLTGGPGAGKTAILELARKQLCEHIAILPESASIVFGGGFWRLESATAKMAAQRAIYFVQRELESLARNEKRWGLGLCDRGTIDGLAYWPREEESYWENLCTTKEIEFKKYSCVIHLRTPTEKVGYNFQNPIRIETALEAARIDQRIARVWADHPKYYEIESSHDFLVKAEKAIEIIKTKVPSCCLEAAARSKGKMNIGGLYEG